MLGYILLTWHRYSLNLIYCIEIYPVVRMAKESGVKLKEKKYKIERAVSVSRRKKKGKPCK